MRTAAQWMYALAALVAIAGIAVGVALAVHTVQDCASFVCTSSHPFVWSGLGVAVGALVNAAVLGVVGRLCEVVGHMREALGLVVEMNDEPSVDGGASLYGPA